MSRSPLSAVLLRGLVLVLGLVLGLGACRAPAPVTSQHVLAEIHALVSARYFDPELQGVDWRRAVERARDRLVIARTSAEDSAVFDALLAELGTSHTTHLTDEEPAWYVLLELFWEGLEPARRAQLFPAGRPDWPGIGVLPERVEEDGEAVWFARTVLAGGPAAAAGVRVGDRLVAVEGEPFRPVAPFRGRAGVPTRLTVQRTRDPASAREGLLVPESIAPSEAFRRALRLGARVYHRGPRTLAYAPLVSWAGEAQQAELAGLLLRGELAGADGLVLDLRGGFGGANPDDLSLFQRGVPRLSFRERDGQVHTFASSWSKPVVLLVDEGTTSGKEVLARAFQRSGRARIVGARTAGAVLGGSVYLLADGSLLYLAVSDVRVDGERLEGTGVTPDVLVPSARPWSGGADPQLERALATLEEELSPSSP